MHLRGEGTVANHVRAVELYETAAEESHVRALNGLGHEYFTGHALPRNFVSHTGVRAYIGKCCVHALSKLKPQGQYGSTNIHESSARRAGKTKHYLDTLLVKAPRLLLPICNEVVCGVRARRNTINRRTTCLSITGDAVQ